MKAQELRIGNLVHQVSRSNAVNLPLPFAMQVWQVGIFNSEILTTDERPESAEFIKVANTDLLPIPLTPEWLEKFGAKRYGHGSGYLIDSYYLSVAKDGSFLIGILFADNSITNLKKLKHVHQLQNLYFALTGEELTIKELATK